MKISSNSVVCVVWLLALTFCNAISSVRSTSVVFDISQAGSEIYAERMNGTCLPIWNSTGVYDQIFNGLQRANFALLRFPNGSMSNEYHWNGSGKFDENGIWIADTAEYKSGFVSITKYRGTSKYHYGFSGYSLITDGDTSTFWWSDPLTETTLPWVYFEFTQAQRIDSVEIYFGEQYGIDFDISIWKISGLSWPIPHHFKIDNWTTVASVRDNHKRKVDIKISQPIPSNFLRISFKKLRGTTSGVQLCEVYAYSAAQRVTVNKPEYKADAASQTKVRAFSTHCGNLQRPDWATGWVSWDFETFMEYVRKFSYKTEPVICVAYSCGTPQEAAAWVYYANIKKKYGIKFWQIGNEMDGDWEEGGPLTALMYAEKFVTFSKAMKAVDPSIKIFGPVLASADFINQGSGDYNNKSWMETFIEYVGAREKADGMKYVDGIDFHSYPYWFSSVPAEKRMLEASDYVYNNSDTLIAFIKRYLLNPDSVLIFMSEYNSSVQISSKLQEPINATVIANMYGGFAEKFTNRAMTVVWDSYEGESMGPDGTWGSLSLFTQGNDLLITKDQKPVSAAWWAMYLCGNLWLNPSFSQKIVSGKYSRDLALRAYGAVSDHDFRTMLVNVSLDTISVNCSIENAPYKILDIYKWGPEEFSWKTKGRNSFALPNCGPSSKRLILEKSGLAKEILLPPYTIAVCRYSNTDSKWAPARSFISLGAYPKIVRDTAIFSVWGTVACGGDNIKKLAYRLKPNSDFVEFTALDGQADGPCESFLLQLRGNQLPKGSQVIYIKATSTLEEEIIDSIDFNVTGALRPIILIDDFEDQNMQCLLPTQQRWRNYMHKSVGSAMEATFEKGPNSNACLNINFTISQPQDLTYDNFAALYLDIDSGYIDTAKPPIKGISFMYKSSHSSGNFVLHANSSRVTDYDEFHIVLENTKGQWKEAIFSWSDFRQYGWGQPKGSLNEKEIKRLEFRMVGRGEGSFSIDNVMFVGDTLVENPILPHKKSYNNKKETLFWCKNQNMSTIALQWDNYRFIPQKIIAVDGSGKIRYFDSIIASKSFSYTIDTQRWPSGVYLLKLQGQKVIKDQKIAIIR